MDDYFLSQTVFIEDPYYPGLPVYSEWGYNTFGTYIDRKPFVSSDNELPAKIIVNSDTLRLLLKGTMEGRVVSLKFSIEGFDPASYPDLTELNQDTINLKDSGRQVILTIDNNEQVLTVIEGEIIFSRVQKLYVDEELTRTILSGYFHLKTFLDNEPIAISYGRFDLGIGYENFYNY
jgi:hypothetical protein